MSYKSSKFTSGTFNYAPSADKTTSFIDILEKKSKSTHQISPSLKSPKTNEKGGLGSLVILFTYWKV